MSLYIIHSTITDSGSKNFLMQMTKPTKCSVMNCAVSFWGPDGFSYRQANMIDFFLYLNMYNHWDSPSRQS